MSRSALVTIRPRGVRGPRSRGIPVARTPEQWAEHDAPYLETVRTLAAAGATLADLGEAIGRRSPDTVRQFLRRNGIVQQHHRGDTRAVLVLIEPVRWPRGHGVVGYAGVDLEDTGEL